jgi:5-formyltetrahydrofolate cyclo-ligase
MTNGRGGSAHPFDADSLNAKVNLRAEARAIRREAHLAAGPGAGLLIADNFLVKFPWREARAIAGYVSIGDEADVMPLLGQLAGFDAGLALPAVAAPDAALEFRRWHPEDTLEPGPFSTHHPSDAAERVVPDLLLVPLLAFDRKGGRLGYGGGYYDRTLASLRKQGSVIAVGIGYEAQKRDGLPMEAHDQKLDWIVTEQDVWEIG